MLEVAITDSMIHAARAKAEEMGRLNNSITNGDGNLAGFVGEIIVADYLGADLSNTYDYDLSYRNVRIDVKTKRTTVKPQPYYECSVADFNTKQKCDCYFFTRVKDDFTLGWILGFLPKDQFYKTASFHSKGQIDPSNNFTFKADCYNIKISDLLPVKPKHNGSDNERK